MLPFSMYNNSIDVNLYSASSKIPYLLKDKVLEAPRFMAPHSDQPSLFFKCYSDDIYEAILEDLRSHYLSISNKDLGSEEDAASYSGGQRETPAVE